MYVDFQIKEEDLKPLIDKLESLPPKVDDDINSYLEQTGSKNAKNAIMDLIPIGSHLFKGHESHAKNSQPFSIEMEHLGFKIKTKNSYKYLYFPNEGAGTSKNKGAQNFMEKGIEKEYSELIKGINQVLDKAFDELKGE